MCLAIRFRLIVGIVRSCRANINFFVQDVVATQNKTLFCCVVVNPVIIIIDCVASGAVDFEQRKSRKLSVRKKENQTNGVIERV